MEYSHYSVMLKETVDNLNIKEDGIYVDATLGYAGHSSYILSKLSSKGHLFSFDQDEIAIKHAKEKFAKNENVTLIKSNFANLKEELNKRNIENIDGIIYDLGVSSMQIDDSSRGFSYIAEGPLDMRMNTDEDFTAANVVNEYSYNELVNIFQKYGEEKLARLYASKIVEERKQKKFETTKELSDLILNVIPKKDFYSSKSHPAIRVFQAIRIEVNKELVVFEKSLQDAFDMLNSTGRISVITFHSLEDRICKYYFKKYSEIDIKLQGLPQIPDEFKPKGKTMTRKPILPTKKELEENSRSKSAKLRVLERV